LFTFPSLSILVLPFLTLWRLWMRLDLLLRASSSILMTTAAAVPAAATLVMSASTAGQVHAPLELMPLFGALLLSRRPFSLLLKRMKRSSLLWRRYWRPCWPRTPPPPS
jgi:hypothetical protein